MKRNIYFLFVLILFLFLSDTLQTLHATITPDGDVLPGNPNQWDSTMDGYVGKIYNGSVIVDGGSDLLSHYGFIGAGSNVTGLVTIIGTDSTWISNALFVGDNNFVGANGGNGTLNILNGGAVTSCFDSIGLNSGSTGLVTVDGIGSTYNNSIFMVGCNGCGILNITNSGITNTYGSTYIGLGPNSTGTATVDGVGSKWINGEILYVGYQGSGTLNILNGSTVTSRTTCVSAGTGATGTIDFGANGGTLNTGSLCVVPDFLKGTGTINTGSFIGDLDLVLDSTASLTQTFVYNNPGQNITVNLNMASDPSNNGALGAGWVGNGSLTIKNGIQVTSNDESILGNASGSRGVATVDGIGSKWTHNGFFFRVGVFGSGMLNIIKGGTFYNQFYCIIGDQHGSTGVVKVDGTNSFLTTESITVGSNGSGTLNITDGGTVKNSSENYIGCYSGSTGIATVNGIGSKWICLSPLPLNIGYYDGSVGTLKIANGGSVSASSVSINSQSSINIDVGNHSLLNLNNGSGTIDNKGKVRILAGAGAAITTYIPISAATWNNNGAWQPIGGTWDTSTHQFAVSAATNGASGTEISDVNLAYTQRLLVSASGGWSVGASFLASSRTMNFTATAISGTTLANLQTLAAGQSVLSGWEFSADNYTVSSTNPVYLSLKVGSEWLADDLDLWHYTTSNGWEPYTATDLIYDGSYASFTVTSFSGYAVTGLTAPEPTTLILLSISGVSLLAYIWKRRRTA
jgi:T5SS/PEP-CTERM-associated repeat protein